MTDVTHTATHDECWSCSRTLEEGMVVIEVRMMMSFDRGLRYEELPNNVYERSCLKCALEDDGPGGINEDNLDACYPNWRADPSFTEPTPE